MDLPVASLIIVSIVLAIAAVFDWRERRVPNWLSYSALIAGVLWQAAHGEIATAAAGVVACGSVGVLMYVLSQLGAGDAKLLMAIGAWLGAALGLDVVLLALVGGAVIAVAMLVRAGAIGSMVRELWLCVMTLSTSGARLWVPDGKLSFPLAPVIAVSFGISVFCPSMRPISPILEALS